jgi:hypothetical protein
MRIFRLRARTLARKKQVWNRIPRTLEEAAPAFGYVRKKRQIPMPEWASIGLRAPIQVKSPL